MPAYHSQCRSQGSESREERSKGSIVNLTRVAVQETQCIEREAGEYREYHSPQ
jgi:hypothetical protein